MIEPEYTEIEITPNDCQAFHRLDQLLTQKIKSISRSGLKKLFLQDMIVAVQDVPLELNKMPPPRTLIRVFLPPPLPSEIQPENIPLDIVYEDEHLLFINKPAGMVVHPAPGNLRGTLANGLLHHCPKIKKIGTPGRPGIVHRIDKGTTGILVVAKEQKCYEKLILLFGAHKIDRLYQAIILGKNIPPSGELRCTIGRNPHNRLKMKANTPDGKNAISHYRLKEVFSHTAHLELRLETGRTHQIRVQLSSLLRTPILGDTLYGRKRRPTLPGFLDELLKSYPYPLLHARQLGFVHPITRKNICFEVEPHKIFTQALNLLRQENNG